MLAYNPRVDAPVISYPQTLTRWGVTYEKSDSHLSITVAPVPGWRHLPRGFPIGAAGLLGIIATYTFFLLQSPPPRNYWFLIGIGQFTLPLIILLGTAWRRLKTRITITVTPSTFRIARSVRSGKPSETTWRREEIGAVRYNVTDQQIAIWITGKDIVDLFVSVNSEVTKWIACELDAAVKDLPLAVAPQGAPVPISVTDVLAPLPRGRARSALIAIAIVLILLAGAAVFTPYPAISIALLLVAAMLLGIALGSQKKEAWQ